MGGEVFLAAAATWVSPVVAESLACPPIVTLLNRDAAFLRRLRLCERAAEAARRRCG